MRSFHDPEIGVAKIADEVMMLQTELLGQEGVFLRLRPGYVRHLLGPEACKESLQERPIRFDGIS